jgi:hypothetical protein
MEKAYSHWRERPRQNREIVDKEGTVVFRESPDKVIKDADGRVLGIEKKQDVDIDLRENDEIDPALAVGAPPELPPLDASDLVEEESDLHAARTQILDKDAFHAAQTLFKPGPKLASLAEDGDLHGAKTHFLDRIGSGPERDNKTAIVDLKKRSPNPPKTS